MNAKDCKKLDEMVDQLNQWEWPSPLGSRPPQHRNTAEDDDIRIAYYVLVRLANWAHRQRQAKGRTP